MNAVIGFPLVHSLSPAIHRKIYESLGIDCEFVKDEDENIADLAKRIRQKPYGLVAVTMPHKQAVIEYLDQVDPAALEIGAVNTVINKDGVLRGYNTDVAGIEKALGGLDLKDKGVLLLGAGGAARSAAYFVSKKGGKLFIYNRSKDRAEKLAREFGGKPFDSERASADDFDLIINATPVGMKDSDEIAVDPSLLAPHQTVFDMVYNPAETRLLREAKNIGAWTISGLRMLVGQALEQVALWLKVEFSEQEFKIFLNQISRSTE